MSVPMPNARDITSARKAFEEHEPRNLFYKVAAELVKLALEKRSDVSLAEALAVLLQTWNRSYYQYKKFTQAHFSDIQSLLNCHGSKTRPFRTRNISSLAESDRESVERLFNEFEIVLGPVGAAKSLHLLAPEFFPLWDRKIAVAYQLPLKSRGANAGRYFDFMRITYHQCAKLKNRSVLQLNPLKALDEYNYCKFTKKWI